MTGCDGLPVTISRTLYSQQIAIGLSGDHVFSQN
jgi:hypothetical protein